MECRTCHHEHPVDATVDDALPYSDPHFCIARLSEQLSDANLQIHEMRGKIAVFETVKHERDLWADKAEAAERLVDRLQKERDGYRSANETLCKALNAHHFEGGCKCAELNAVPEWTLKRIEPS